MRVKTIITMVMMMVVFITIVAYIEWNESDDNDVNEEVKLNKKQSMDVIVLIEINIVLSLSILECNIWGSQ